MASSTDDGIEEVVGDAISNKKVQSIDLISGRLLGKGLSSIVYETTWKGRVCARKDFLRVPSDIFEREAAVLVGLDYENANAANLVRTYCWTVDEGSCSLVVELIDDDLLSTMQKRKVSAQKRKVSARKRNPGTDPSDASQTSHLIDLHKFIEEGKNAPVSTAPPGSAASALVYLFSMPEALHIMLQIAKAINVLHDNGVAHGDLKPKNILVTPSGKAISSSLGQDLAFKVKVADFGLFETKMKSKSLVSRQSRKLEMVRWRAPELWDMNLLREDKDDSFTDSDWDSDHSSRKSVGRIHKFTYGKLSRADVYSFALTCSQILTGEDPYSDLGLNDLIRRIPKSLRPGLPPTRCPPQLGRLINKCWGEEFKRPTFIEILSELKDLQASLTADSWVGVRTLSTTAVLPDLELTLSAKLPKYVTDIFAENQLSETLGSLLNSVVRTQLRSSEIHNEKIVQPTKLEEHSIEDIRDSPKLSFVPKQRRRREKVYSYLGCLGYIPDITRSSKESGDIQEGRVKFGSYEPFSPTNDERYKAEIERNIGAKRYTLAEISLMTMNFKYKIGNGGSGSIYYGKLSDGREVAVKVGSSREGDRELLNEIEILSRIRHKNLVALVGYCQTKKDHLLIYEYMENGSLYDHLSGDRKSAGMLGWKMRLRVSLDVAQGLEYLHTGCGQSFVHRDVKSSNILLSKNYDAKLTDFGLAVLIRPRGLWESEYFDFATVKSTAGYLDPEYGQSYLVSTKSDIYSFGVVLLELITGRPPLFINDSSTSDRQRINLCDWVREALQRGGIHEILDPALKSSSPAPSEDALWKFAEIAIRCVEPKSIHRPTMNEVIQELHKALKLEEGLASMDPSSSVINTEPYNKLPEPSEPTGMWESEIFVLQKRRRRKAYSCLGRLGCITAEPVSMGKGNGDISTSSSTNSIRSLCLRLRAGKSRADLNAQDTILMGPRSGANRPKSFTLAEIGVMTRNFKYVIGKGGFGPVYYGVLPDGRKVAVKKNDGSTRQGEREFFNEIDLLARVSHKNLVALLGYCLDRHKILIYEYMENGSLYDHLHGDRNSDGMLGWKMRLQIALNVAQGLDYLHSGCTPSFIHRDVKSSNVLISANYDAKVADFGLSRLGLPNDDDDRILTIVMGTPGYLDPEYYSTHYVSAKSDIYSFGVVLLELITGRPPLLFNDSSTSDRQCIKLCDWVREALQKGGNHERGGIHEILDPSLKSPSPAPSVDALWKFAEIALRCVELKSIHRPTMSEVIQELRELLGLEEAVAVPSNVSSSVLEIPGSPLQQVSDGSEIVELDSDGRASVDYSDGDLKLLQVD